MLTYILLTHNDKLHQSTSEHEASVAKVKNVQQDTVSKMKLTLLAESPHLSMAASPCEAM